MTTIRNVAVAFFLMVAAVMGQSQVGFTSWNDISRAPFEHDIVGQGADAVTGTFGKFFNTQAGVRYTYGADSSKDYERQLSAFANVAVFHTFKHGMIRGGEEFVSTYRQGGRSQKNLRPFVETWFGGGKKYPVNTWASFTKNQFGEGYVLSGSYNQGVKVAKVIGLDVIVNGGPGFAYGARSENPWNRQLTLRGGVRLQRNVGSGQAGVGASYIEGFRPNGLRDNVTTFNVFWWFGKNLTL